MFKKTLVAAALATATFGASAYQIGENNDFNVEVYGVAAISAVNYNVGGQDLAVFFKPGTLSALDGLLIGDSDDIGATGLFDAELDGRKLTFRLEGDSIVDNDTESLEHPWTGDRGPANRQEPEAHCPYKYLLVRCWGIQAECQGVHGSVN